MATNLRGLFNAKGILAEEQQWYYLTHCPGDKEVYTYPKDICRKVNPTERLEFELVSFEDIVQHFSHEDHLS